VWACGIGQDLLRGQLLWHRGHLLPDRTLHGRVQEEDRTRVYAKPPVLQRQLRQQRVRVAAHREASLDISIGPESEASNMILGEAFWK
jgi:hypothetical protein